MSTLLSRVRQDVTARFLVTLIVALGFMSFLAADQMHWWRLKPDYSFGWLVPVFVAYVIIDRWAKIRAIFKAIGPSLLSGIVQRALGVAAGISLAAGSLLFLLGAFYRAGSGPTQPGSFALAVGFACVLPAMIYFNVPGGQIGTPAPVVGWRAVYYDARLRAAALFLFPAVIWMLSAPLVTAVENTVSLFLLRKVVTIVFSVFNLLGFPMIQEGNVLVLPKGRVGVVEACSGIRSLMGCLFAGGFLAAVYLNRFWKKIVLIGAALCLAFFGNLVRSLFLTGWAYAYGSAAIEGDLHDRTGLAVLGLTVLGLFALLPLFSASGWSRVLRFFGQKKTPPVSQPFREPPLASAKQRP